MLASHDRKLISRYCNKVIRMEGGHASPVTPIGEMENFADNLRAALPAAIGEHKLWIFGHLGDGNLHVIVQVKPQDYMASRPKIEALVYSPLAAFRGSVSAEHGIGLEKKAYLKVSRSETEIALMRTLKAALDPKGILNPGKIF